MTTTEGGGMDERTTAARRRFVDPERLVCPGCGERVACEPPAYWRVADGLPVPQFSHDDRSSLCRHAHGVVAGPVEAAA